MPALRQLSPAGTAALKSAAMHPAVAEVLDSLALVPGMRFVLQCIAGPAYAKVLAGADLGIPLGQQQVCAAHSMLCEEHGLPDLHEVTQIAYITSVKFHVACMPCHKVSHNMHGHACGC